MLFDGLTIMKTEIDEVYAATSTSISVLSMMKLELEKFLQGEVDEF